MDVKSILNQSIQIIKPIAAEKNIEIIEELKLERHIVFADTIRLKQIMLNLLSNAVKYNRKGGSITLKSTELSDNKLRISVTDTGRGIDSEKINLLFQPFERLGAEFTDVQGTGIGLALSSKLAELMGASMGVSSILDEGSTFWIDLTMVNRVQNYKFSENINLNIEESNPDKFSFRVLYVEDNAANLKVVESMLKYHKKITLLSATTGEYGFDLACRYTPDIILLDIHLPDMDGYEVLKMLQTDPATSSIPVIALSADAMPIDIERGLKKGFVNYLTKPVLEEDLIEALEAAIAVLQLEK